MTQQYLNAATPVPTSPAEAARDLHELHNQTTHLPPEIIGAGAIVASGLTTESGLLLPAGYDRPKSVSTPGETAPAVLKAVEVEAPGFVSETVWAAMTPEQRSRAGEIRTALATGELKRYGVSEDTLRVVTHEDQDGQQRFVVVHTGPGVDLGHHKENHDEARSYRSIMAAKNGSVFQVTVDGKTYDARQGMTDAVYDAKFADAKERGVTLPDSQQLAQETGDDWTWTMLTGEPLTAGGRVRFRDVGGGRVFRIAARHPDVGRRRGLRVCPAVDITK